MKSRLDSGKPLAPEATEMAQNGFKRCRKCKEVKSVDRFKVRKEKPDGLNAYCHECEGKSSSARYRRRGQSMQSATLSYWKDRVKTQHLSGLDAGTVKEKYETGPSCVYCKEPLAPKDVHLDHATPRSRGGLTIIENIVISCADCNWLKRSRTELEFRAFLKQYVARFSPVSQIQDSEVRVYSLAEYAAKAQAEVKEA